MEPVTNDRSGVRPLSFMTGYCGQTVVGQGLLEWYRVIQRVGTRAAVIPSSIVMHVAGTVGDIAYRELLLDTWKFANKTHEGNGLPLNRPKRKYDHHDVHRD